MKRARAEGEKKLEEKTLEQSNCIDSDGMRCFQVNAVQCNRTQSFSGRNARNLLEKKFSKVFLCRSSVCRERARARTPSNKCEWVTASQQGRHHTATESETEQTCRVLGVDVHLKLIVLSYNSFYSCTTFFVQLFLLRSCRLTVFFIVCFFSLSLSLAFLCVHKADMSLHCEHLVHVFRPLAFNLLIKRVFVSVVFNAIFTRSIQACAWALFHSHTNSCRCIATFLRSPGCTAHMWSPQHFRRFAKNIQFHRALNAHTHHFRGKTPRRNETENFLATNCCRHSQCRLHLINYTLLLRTKRVIIPYSAAMACDYFSRDSHELEANSRRRILPEAEQKRQRSASRYIYQNIRIVSEAVESIKCSAYARFGWSLGLLRYTSIVTARAREFLVPYIVHAMKWIDLCGVCLHNFHLNTDLLLAMIDRYNVSRTALLNSSEFVT